MVELKPKICVKQLCACRGPYHHHHHRHLSISNTNTATASPTITTNTTPTVLQRNTTTTTPTSQLQRQSHQRQQQQLSAASALQNRHQQLVLRQRYLAPQSKMGSGPHASRIVRKYRRSRLKRVKRQEYQKLREMVPALHERPRVSKVEVIEEAIKYIDELHTALIQRFRARGLPSVLKDVPLEAREVHGGNIRELVRHLLATSNPASLPPSRIENARTLPSFIQKISKARRL
ncbi:uncharacterized protein LOC135194945 [Macrobrachium nipponense]|uniref:uncharacterized protein LOC135194945 n=1 Tax=Macrobrachium nipponense TaxID=159736 RepID=UPI0030C7E799